MFIFAHHAYVKNKSGSQEQETTPLSCPGMASHAVNLKDYCQKPSDKKMK